MSRTTFAVIAMMSSFAVGCDGDVATSGSAGSGSHPAVTPVATPVATPSDVVGVVGDEDSPKAVAAPMAQQSSMETQFSASSPFGDLNAPCGALSEFRHVNVLALEDFKGEKSDIEGALVAGGSVELRDYSIGAALEATVSRFDLVAGRNLTLNHRNVKGLGIYGAALHDDQFPDARIVQGNVVPWNVLRISVQGLSQDLAQKSLTIAAEVLEEGEGRAVRINSSSGLNVFTLESSVLAKTHRVEFNGPSDAIVVVNVRGSSAAMKNFGMSLGNVRRENILWNFSDATSLSVSGIAVEGSILAPMAQMNFNSGVIAGIVVAKSIKGTGQFNYAPFRACLSGPREATFAWDEFSDSTDSSGVGGTPYELFGLAVRQLGDMVVVGLNTNTPLAGVPVTGASQGKVALGDIFFNFSPNLASFSGADRSRLFGVHFTDANDSGVTALGLYKDVEHESRTLANNGYQSYASYADYVQGRQALGLGNIPARNGYIPETLAVSTAIKTGVASSAAGFVSLSKSELQLLGIDFEAAKPGFALGTYSHGFAFRREAGMKGDFIAHLSVECGNDLTALKGRLD